jgi:CheY-like chemotaxis protein
LPVAAARADARDVALSILVVDDDAGFRDLVADLLTARGFAVVPAVAGPAEALVAFRRHRPQCVLIDVNLAGHDGRCLAYILSREDPVPAMVLTSTDTLACGPAEVEACGAVAFVRKDRLGVTDLAGLFSSAGR